MSDKNCSECIYYTAPKTGHTCGECKYPVPEWLRISGCPFVTGYEAVSCVLYKTPQDVYQEKEPEE